MMPQRYIILELYNDDPQELTSREVFEELIPYLGGADPDHLELTTDTVKLTHITNTCFYLKPVDKNTSHF